MNLAKQRVSGAADHRRLSHRAYPDSNVFLSAPLPVSSPSPVCLDQHSVSSARIDELAEAQQNWIGMLHPDWEIDSSGCRFPLAEDGIGGSLTIRQLVLLTQQSRQQAVRTESNAWVDSLCLRVVGLGRVRLVLRFDDQHQDECAVLATNRLDWSPRRVLAEWSQPAAQLFESHPILSRPISSHPISSHPIGSRPAPQPNPGFTADTLTAPLASQSTQQLPLPLAAALCVAGATGR